VRATDGDALAGALVVATDERGTVAASTTTTPDGAYRIDALVPGGYTVTVSAPGHRPAAEPTTVSGTGARCDIELSPAPSVEGTVRSRDGHPLAGARVTLLDAAGEVVAARSTGADGRYCFAGLAGAEYTVIASGYSPVAAPIVLNGSSRDGVDLFLGNEDDVNGREVPGRQATSVISQV
jgi:uncharacterized surface anchored protein